MKVICAGLSKTGTKSFAKALRILGYSVYDHIEHLEILGDQWQRIFEGESAPDLLRSMYGDIDAACDLPVYTYWKEFHEAFPEAKVVLLVRDQEDQWITSLLQQRQQIKTSIKFIAYVSMTYLKYRRFVQVGGATLFSKKVVGKLKLSGESSRANLIEAYRKQNAEVKNISFWTHRTERFLPRFRIVHPLQRSGKP